ncbi:hydroxymethylglutaryl-CoA synthase [Flavobacterium urumqiense]|uniref:Hydroxymethylglutaryl-CoA synthase n=2 Tax=Flavobacterium urumqiense TaxID=935224 RepID=A0A1H5TCP8_9FLAO|nr:hydroxymethylglutaryl-CoA synthase [Flavobacterium urumqiense]
MHLPCAFQGRRMMSEIYALDSSNTIISVNEEASEYQNKLKEISKSKAYKEFVKEKLMAAELATSLLDNLYTGAIFMGLL